MTKPKKGAAKPPRPHQGGSYIRDPKTGALTRAAVPPEAPAPTSAEAGPVAPEAQEN